MIGKRETYYQSYQSYQLLSEFCICIKLGWYKISLGKLLGDFTKIGAEKIPAHRGTSSTLMTLPKAPTMLK